MSTNIRIFLSTTIDPFECRQYALDLISIFLTFFSAIIIEVLGSCGQTGPVLLLSLLVVSVIF